MPKNPQPWQSLAVKHRHSRDLDIEFDEPTHRYYIKGDTSGWISCTGFLHAFFPHFDAEKTIKKMMKSSNWPTSKYYGKTAKEIKAEWDANGKEASNAGTLVHLGIEQYHNGATDLITKEVKKAVEWKYFSNFWKIAQETLEPYRTEWEVWSEEYKLAGSIDMIYRRKCDGKFEIYDWKRSKEIKTGNDFETGYPPLEHLPHCNYWHYTLQLNIYRWFLQKYYGLEIVDLYLVIVHPDNKNYKRFRLNILEKEVEDMLACRARAIACKSKESVLLPLPESIEEEENVNCDFINDD